MTDLHTIQIEGKQVIYSGSLGSMDIHRPEGLSLSEETELISKIVMSLLQNAGV